MSESARSAPAAVANIAAYKFMPLDDRTALRVQLLERCRALQLRGTILLAPEGINLFLAGAHADVEALCRVLRGDTRFAGIEFKWSWSESVPFKRLRVRLKREIITLRMPHVDATAAPYLPPQQLKRWLDENRDVVLLDTRNDFEYRAGSFRNALNPQLQSFGEFPRVAKQLQALRNKTIVTFCTGGIRCEKAAPFLRSQGYTDVWQLQGGILKYFEECGGAHYQGDCFVFDERGALAPDLQPIATAE